MLLDVQNLSVEFTRRGKPPLHAVNGVSLGLAAGESLGIVGESGSGKSVSCFALARLLPPRTSRVSAGSILFRPEPEGEAIDLARVDERRLRSIRGRQMSWVFQDPMTALTPWVRVLDQVAEPLVIHGLATRKQAREIASEKLASAGIAQPDRYPHQFSGGMRQRALIAMALITRPALLVADEPTTALDVSLQKQILDLVDATRKENGSAVILISHDFDVVARYCDRVMVMYAGEVIETAPVGQLLAEPRHAYTRGLLKAMPNRAEAGQELFTIPGMPPRLDAAPCGCMFRARNTLGRPELCPQEGQLALVEIAPGHWVKDCPGCVARG